MSRPSKVTGGAIKRLRVLRGKGTSWEECARTLRAERLASVDAGTCRRWMQARTQASRVAAKRAEKAPRKVPAPTAAEVEAIVAEPLEEGTPLDQVRARHAWLWTIAQRMAPDVESGDASMEAYIRLAKYLDVLVLRIAALTPAPVVVSPADSTAKRDAEEAALLDKMERLISAAEARAAGATT